MSKKIEEIDAQLEQIGMIGSPSSTSEFSLDILETAVNKKLVGELATFHFHQDGQDNYAIGQITEIQLRNMWLEGASMRSIARQKGTVNPISGQQDTHLGKMTVSAVFAQTGDSSFQQSMLGTVPPTGTYIRIAEDALIQKILEKQQKELFYLGTVYGSKPLLPLTFRHFDSGVGGAGEAYHLGIFGKSGSGKTTLAQLITLGYAKHQNLSIFILDPQGQFAKDVDKPLDGMNNPLSRETLGTLKRRYQVYDINNITLNRWELFAQFLVEFKFFETLGIKFADYQKDMGDYVEESLRNAQNVKFTNLDVDTLKSVLTVVEDNISTVYSGKAYQDKVKEIIAAVRLALQESKPHRIIDIWSKIISLFRPTDAKKSTRRIIQELIQDTEKKIVIIDLSKSPTEIAKYVWEESIKPLIIDCFIDDLTRAAEFYYKGDKSLNTLVVIDEAHRLAPSGRSDNTRKDKIKQRLVDGARTTRKYGLGWMFISQTLASLDKEIIEQLRIYFLGFGLSMGSEFQKLKEIAGGDTTALRLYQNFRDPHSSLTVEDRQYSFMTMGPVSPLSFAGTPLFLTAFNDIDLFKTINGLS